MADVREETVQTGEGVRAPIVAELVRLSVAYGATPARLQTVTDGLLRDDGRVPYSKAMTVWSALAEAQPAKPHGLLIGAASTTTFGALRSVTTPARTVRDALKIVADLFSAFTSEGRISLHDDPQGTRLEIRHRGEVEGLGYPVEFCLALLVRLVAGPHGAGVVQRASFQHAPLGTLRAYAPQLGSSISFESNQNAVVFHDDALDRPNSRSDPLMVLYRRLETEFPNVTSFNATHVRIEEAVERVTEQGRFNLAATAQELGWSTRTLQRKAKDAGIELRTTLRAARKALAIALLRDRSLCLGTIAERLDYADERSFSRAFERWTGMTPTQWRRRR